jgi:hypothetical protein
MLDMNQPASSPAFFAGNRRFLTKKLWGAANEPPFFHHGPFTTIRQAVMAQKFSRSLTCNNLLVIQV